MTIAREGYTLVAISVVVAVLASALAGIGAALPLWVIAVFVVQFFREPSRTINPTPNAVLSAADGRVVFVGNAPSPRDGSDKLKISVFMNVFNAHVNRAPVAGTVTHSQRFPGSFLNAALDKSSHENERHLIAIDHPAGEVVAVQIAGLLARRVLCYAEKDSTLTLGQRYGFIRFGSRVDLYLPPECRPQVGLGDKTFAGLSIVALLPQEDEAAADKAEGTEEAAA